MSLPAERNESLTEGVKVERFEAIIHGVKEEVAEMLQEKGGAIDFPSMEREGIDYAVLTTRTFMGIERRFSIHANGEFSHEMIAPHSYFTFDGNGIVPISENEKISLSGQPELQKLAILHTLDEALHFYALMVDPAPLLEYPYTQNAEFDDDTDNIPSSFEQDEESLRRYNLSVQEYLTLPENRLPLLRRLHIVMLATFANLSEGP